MRHLRLCDPRNLLISSALNRRVTFCDVVINVDLHYSFSGIIGGFIVSNPSRHFIRTSKETTEPEHSQRRDAPYNSLPVPARGNKRLREHLVRTFSTGLRSNPVRGMVVIFQPFPRGISKGLGLQSAWVKFALGDAKKEERGGRGKSRSAVLLQLAMLVGRYRVTTPTIQPHVFNVRWPELPTALRFVSE